MSPGNEIRIWHSLALKCKRGVLALPWQFIIKAREFLLNIHEVQWIITGLAIITNFSKCTDKRVKYIIFPNVTRTDYLNGFWSWRISYFLWICFILCPILHNATLSPSVPFFSVERKWKREGGLKMSPASIRVLSTALIHLCQQRVPLPFSQPQQNTAHKSTDASSPQPLGFLMLK